MVFLTEPQKGTPSLGDVSDITLYNLFVWQHHYPAKDSDNEGKIGSIIALVNYS